MLTARGWWFLLIVIIQIVVGILFSDRGLGVIAILGLTFLGWFIYEWCFFSLQMRLAIQKIRIRRDVRDGKRSVPILWVGKELEVHVDIELDSQIPLPFVIFNDRFPSGADHLTGNNEIATWITNEETIHLRYSIRTNSPGELRFEGLRVQIADRQGFFYHRKFIRDLVSYAVLPPLTDAEGNRRISKHHNLIPPPGIHRLKSAGGGGDLLDLRDYRPGDPPKMIAWKASARRDRLITKEFESDVPIRCTLFVDQSQSVRLGQPKATMLNQLTMIASGVSQAASSDRDMVGLVLFDEHDTSILQPARTSRHQIELLHRLSDAARARPISPIADVNDLMKVAIPVATEIYPELMSKQTNRTPFRMFWNPLLDGRWGWFVILLMLLPLLVLVPGIRRAIQEAAFTLSGAPSGRWYTISFLLMLFSPLIVGLFWWIGHGLQTMFSPYYQLRDRRKRLASLFSALDHAPIGNIGLLLEDDHLFGERLQLFLATHHIRYPIDLYDEKGRYLFRSEEKIKTLSRAMHYVTARGRDNELYVIMADLIELDEYLDPLLKSVKVAIGRHHQVLVICPWMPEIPPPSKDFGEEPSEKELRKQMKKEVRRPNQLSGQLLTETMIRYHQAFYRVRRAFARMGVVLIRADEGEPVRLILNKLDRLRSIRRRR